MKQHINKIKGLTLAMLVLFAVACGGGSGEGQQDEQAEATSTGLTEFEQAHGIGPIEEPIELDDEINQQLAERGADVFKTKCSACHKVSERYVGPPMENVLAKRTPTYVMNMILNPVEMTKKHPEARKMLAEYMTQMTFQNVAREDARAIVEYLRTIQEEE